MKPANGATPLIALSAVAVDTETTGLDVGKARIIQIGAVSIKEGRAQPDLRFDALVDPGEPVPEASTRIHGITSADLVGKPDFSSVWREFQSFTADRVLIGHSIGFDLAIMRRECLEAGITWAQPAALCIRLLGALVNPKLPDHSLDTLAAWLGVSVEGRHTARGDAAAAADIFVALLPELRKRNIRTLGEAELACLSLSNQLEEGQRAGWVEPVSRPHAPVFEHVDPYAYRHQAGSLMSHPPVVVKPDWLLRDTIDLMVGRKISSVLVSAAGAHGSPVSEYGIVTERDVMRLIADEGAAGLDVPVGSIATRPVVSVREAAFVYRAIGRMQRLGIRHLAVRNDAGLLVGILSARDLLKLRASAAISLDDEIEQANDAAALASAWAGLPGVVRSLLAEDIEPHTIAEIISEELRALTRRAAILAERAMEEEGYGAPPVPYVVLVLGSGGRGESLLAPDQDNAIIFERGEPGGPEDQWFQRLGEKISDSLDAAGVPYCKGGVMARNAEFCGSVDTWMRRVDEWITRSRPEDLLNVDIVFDLKPVHGDFDLSDQMFTHAYSRGHTEPVFAKLLGDQIAPTNAFTVFGGLQAEAGRFDLKMHGLFPIVAAARALAIRHGVAKLSTRARLQGLLERDMGGAEDMSHMLAGHSFLIGLLLRQQIKDIFDGIQPSNRVELGELSKAAHNQLKAVIRDLKSVPNLVRDLMFP